MENESTIAALNSLIQINNDRIEGYRTAAEEAEGADLKAFFAELKATSVKNNFDLRAEVLRLNGKPNEDTSTSGKFYRAWMDVKAALTGNDRKAILSSCEYGEDVAKSAYVEILSNEKIVFTAEQRSLLQQQHLQIVADHDRVKGLRNAAA